MIFTELSSNYTGFLIGIIFLLIGIIILYQRELLFWNFPASLEKLGPGKNRSNRSRIKLEISSVLLMIIGIIFLVTGAVFFLDSLLALLR